MCEYLLVGEALVSHDGGANLAQAYAVSPAFALQHEIRAFTLKSKILWHSTSETETS